MNSINPESIKWYYHTGSAWSEITQYVLHRSSWRGGWGIKSNRYTDRLAGTGVLTITLNSYNGRFDPDSANCLTGWRKNAKVKLVITFDGQAYTRFYGYVDTIKLDYDHGDYTASVSIVDWMAYAYKRTLKESSIETYRRGGYAVDKIVDAVGVTPLATQYSDGDYEFEAIFDSLTTTTKAATELNKIVLSENGYFYNRHDKVNGETLVFEAESYRSGARTISKLPKLKADSGHVLKAGFVIGHVLLAGTTDKLILNETQDAHINGTAQAYSRTHGGNILNSITVTAYPKRVDTTEQTLYSLGTPIKIASGETSTITVKYQNKDTKEDCNAITSLMIQPVATTDYLMNTKKDGTGTNITDELTVSVVYHTASADVTLENTSAYTGKITKLELRGYGVYQDSEIKSVAEDATSITNYGDSELNIEQQYQRDTAPGAVMANKILQKEKNPRTRLDRVQMVANTSSVHMLAFLNVDIGDMVKITETNLGLDDLYYVQGIDFDIIDGSVIVFSWSLVDVRDSLALGTLTEAAIEFTFGGNNCVNYGHIQSITGSNERTVIMSVYPHNTTDNQVIWAVGSYYLATVQQPCSSFRLMKGTGDNMYVRFSNQGFSTTTGVWEWVDCVTKNTWARIAFTYKLGDPLAIPVLYVNGSEITGRGQEGRVTTTPPVGDPISEEGAELMLGGQYYVQGLPAHPYYQNLFDGVWKKPYIYNRILTAGEVALDAAGTVITDGLIFRGSCIPTSKTALYYDQALTTDLPTYDDVGGIVGVIHGSSAICREIT